MNAKVWEDFVDSFSASLVNGGFPQTKDNNEKQVSSNCNTIEMPVYAKCIVNRVRLIFLLPNVSSQ